MIERPKLRPIEAFPVQSNGQRYLCLRDPQGLSEHTLMVSPESAFLLGLFDGEHTITEIQTAFTRRFGQLIFSDKILQFADSLDQALLLDSPSFAEHLALLTREFRAAEVRPSSHAGAGYADNPAALREELDSFFGPPEGPGFPDAMTQANTRKKIKAVVAPHIDFQRGGPTYAWAYRELLEAEPVDLFIILGINHVSAEHSFTLTSKKFETPLGVMPTDQEAVSFFHQRCGDWIFEEELCHRKEHSIEFQVVFLQHLLANRSDGAVPVRIVPVLCSSFLHQIAPGHSPEELEELAQFTGAMRELISSRSGKCCMIASVDLSHVGPRFGDAQPLSPGFLSRVESQNLSLLEKVAALDADGFMKQIQEDEDRTRIDAVPAIYTMLKCLDLSEGRLLKYEQAADWSSQQCVTFVSMAFE